VITITISMMK